MNDKTYTYYNPQRIQELKSVPLDTFGNDKIPSNFFKFYGRLYNRTKIMSVEVRKSQTSSWFDVYVNFVDNTKPIQLGYEMSIESANLMAKEFAKLIYAVE